MSTTRQIMYEWRDYQSRLITESNLPSFCDSEGRTIITVAFFNSLLQPIQNKIMATGGSAGDNVNTADIIAAAIDGYRKGGTVEKIGLYYGMKAFREKAFNELNPVISDVLSDMEGAGLSSFPALESHVKELEDNIKSEFPNADQEAIQGIRTSIDNIMKRLAQMSSSVWTDAVLDMANHMIDGQEWRATQKLRKLEAKVVKNFIGYNEAGLNFLDNLVASILKSTILSVKVSDLQKSANKFARALIGGKASELSDRDTVQALIYNGVLPDDLKQNSNAPLLKLDTSYRKDGGVMAITDEVANKVQEKGICGVFTIIGNLERFKENPDPYSLIFPPKGSAMSKLVSDLEAENPWLVKAKDLLKTSKTLRKLLRSSKINVDKVRNVLTGKVPNRVIKAISQAAGDAARIALSGG